MRAAASMLLLASLLAAGCVTQGAPGALEERAPLQALAASFHGLPCEATSVDAGTSDNLEKVGYLAPSVPVDARRGEIDIHGDSMLVAGYNPARFEVIDISNPANPVLIASRELSDAPFQARNVMDVKWLADGKGAVIGGSAGRIFVFDLTNPANPIHKSTFLYGANNQSGQAHMMETAVIGGKEYVYVATQTDLRPMLILERVGWTLQLRGTYGLPVVRSLALGNHDIEFVEDPLLGLPVIYVADGFAGWNVADVTNPTAPKRLGGSLSAEPGLGYTHTIRVWFPENGKRIVLTMEEVGVNTLKVWDATNLDAPLLLARWNADATRPHIPQHNLQVVDDYLVMAHYTEGAYIFDLAPMADALPVLGTIELSPIAHWAVERRANPDVLGFANVWDVNVKDGLLFLNDITEGMTVVSFGCFPIGDAAYTAS